MNSNENSQGPQGLVFEPTGQSAEVLQNESVGTLDLPNTFSMPSQAPPSIPVAPSADLVLPSTRQSGLLPHQHRALRATAPAEQIMHASRLAPSSNPFAQQSTPSNINRNPISIARIPNTAAGGRTGQNHHITVPQSREGTSASHPLSNMTSNTTNHNAVTGIVTATHPAMSGGAATAHMAHRAAHSNQNSTPTGGSVIRTATDVGTNSVLAEKSGKPCTSTFSRCTRHFLSIKVLVGLMCAFLLACTAGGVLAVMYVFSIRATREEGMRHVETITAKATADLENFIAIPSSFSGAWQQSLSHSAQRLPNETILENVFRSAELFNLRFSDGLVTDTINASMDSVNMTYTSTNLEVLASTVYNGGRGGLNLTQNEAAMFTGVYPQWFEPYFEGFRLAINMSEYNIKWGSIGFEDGSYVECYSEEDNAILTCASFSRVVRVVIRHVRGQPMEVLHTTRTNASLCRTIRYDVHSGTINETYSYRTNYDPRNRSWYYAAPRIPLGSGWSAPYPTADPALLAVDVSRSIFNSSSLFVGLLAFTLDLTVISQFVATMGKGTQNVDSVLLDQNGNLLATSWADVTYKIYKDTVSNPLCQRTTNTTPRPTNYFCVLSYEELGYQPLLDLSASYADIIRDGADVSRLSLDGEIYYVGIGKITTIVKGTDLTNILFLKESDLIEEVIRGRNVGTYISIALVVAAVMINLGVLTLLLRPLGELAENMMRMAALQTDESFDKGLDSNLYEIAAIQSAFVWMRGELHTLKKFVPQSLLAAQRISSDEDDDDGPIVTDSQDDTADGSRTFVVSPTAVLNQTDTVVDFLENQNQNIFDRTESRQNNSRNSRANQPSRQGRNTANGQGSVPMRTITIAPTLNTNASIHSRRVTMLAANVSQFHSHLATCPDASVSIMGVVSEVVHAMEKAAIENKGVMDGFLGDRFMISFNAVTPVGNHASNAASCALAAARNLAQIRIHANQNVAIHRGHQPRVLRLTSGIASGYVLVGNMGSNGVKRFTILGHAVSTATVLERLCKRYAPDTVALTSSDSLPDIENFFEYLLVDAVELPLPSSDFRPTVLLGNTSLEHAYRLQNRRYIASIRGHRSDGGGGSEWMYAITEGAKLSKFANLNRAFLAYVNSSQSASRATPEGAQLPLQSIGQPSLLTPANASENTIPPLALSSTAPMSIDAEDWLFSAKEALRLAIADIDFRDPDTESERLVVELLQTLISKEIPGTSYCNRLTKYYQECVLSNVRHLNNQQYTSGGHGVLQGGTIHSTSIYDLVSVENYQ